MFCIFLPNTCDLLSVSNPNKFSLWWWFYIQSGENCMMMFKTCNGEKHLIDCSMKFWRAFHQNSLGVHRTIYSNIIHQYHNHKNCKAKGDLWRFPYHCQLLLNRIILVLEWVSLETRAIIVNQVGDQQETK